MKSCDVNEPDFNEHDFPTTRAIQKGSVLSCGALCVAAMKFDANDDCCECLEQIRDPQVLLLFISSISAAPKWNFHGEKS
jgi:hypothetical protein